MSAEQREARRLYAIEHKAEASIRSRAWYAANRDKVRFDLIKKHYGITREEVEAALEACGHKCACGLPVDARSHVDHDHGTGRFRGMLCDRCNRTLGMVRDSPEILRTLAAYLERIVVVKTT